MGHVRLQQILASDPLTTEADNLREAAFNLGGSSQIVLDANGTVVMVNEPAQRMFGVTERDIGRPIQDLEISYRPIELRTHLERVAAELRVREVKSVQWTVRDEQRIIDVRLVPLVNDGVLMGSSITHVDVTEAHRLETSCRAPSETSKTRMKSCRQRSRSWRRPTRSSNRPTRSSRR